MNKLEEIREKLQNEEECFSDYTSEEKFIIRQYNIIQSYKTKEWYEVLTDKIFFEDFVWEEELPRFIKALDKFGINEFIYCDTSTASLRTIMFLVENGYSVVGTENYLNDTFLGITTTKKGLVIRKNN